MFEDFNRSIKSVSGKKKPVAVNGINLENDIKKSGLKFSDRIFCFCLFAKDY